MALNFRLIARMLGSVMLLLAAAMVLPAAVALFYRETKIVLAFLISIALILLIALSLRVLSRPSRLTIHIQDAYLFVGASWLLASVFAAFPFIFSGVIPSFADAFFESASGLTTTGASILSDVEQLPRAILFWRSFNHWLGGMGILVFAIALFPSLNMGSFLIASAETPGPELDKLTPKLADSAKLLYALYTGMTIAEVLLLMAGGLTLFDSLIHTFGTVATGGFSSYNASIAHFDSLYVEMVIVVFMILAATNFNLYFLLLRGRFRAFLADREWRMYIAVIIVSSLILSVLLRWFQHTGSLGESLRLSIFQVLTILTTTGYSTSNFALWPTTCVILLFTLMFFGGCSGSTSGSIKIVRILVFFKLVKRGINKRLHPHAVFPVKLGSQNVASHRVSNITSFLFVYILLFFLGALLVSLDGTDLITAITASASCLGNIGPGFGAVGPSMNYGFLSDPIKYFLSFLMIAGRLELFTLLLLFTRTFWTPGKH